jgi:hypothetical protein
MKIPRVILPILWLALAGCVEQKIATIPPGQYIHLETGNTISVDEEGILFLLATKTQEDGLRVSYKLLNDGRIELGTSTSPDIFEIIADNWFYLPPQIERRPRNSEEVSQVFAPSVE